MTRQAWIDGELIAAERVQPTPGTGVFETIGSWGAALPLWPQHIERLTRSALALDLRWRPAAQLHDAALALLRGNGEDVLRLALEPTAGGCRCVLTTRARDGEREPLSVVPAPAPRPTGAHDDRKLWPRPLLDACRQQARAAGAHDALLWRGGQVLEATAYNVFVFVGDRLRTPPADGAILPGIARAALLRSGLPIEAAPVSLPALLASPLVVLTNAVYGPRLARVGAAAGGVVAPWLARLRAAWSEAVGA